MRALIVDDHPLMQEAVARVLQRLDSSVKLGIANNCEHGLELAAQVVSLISSCSISICTDHSNRVALLVHQGSPANEPMLRLMESGAKSLDLALESFAVSDPGAFERIFGDISKAAVDAVLVFEEPMFVANARAVADVAVKHRLPLVGFEEIAGAGGLIGYGVDLLEMIRHSAVFVDKILKGAKAADIPFEQASKFRLTINVRTAQALALKIPQPLLLRADEVIQ